MFFRKGITGRYSVIDALGEPACLFSPEGAPLHSSPEAVDFMARQILPFSQLPDFITFDEAMDSLFPRGRSAEVSLDGGLYEYISGGFDGGILVRFRPLKDRATLGRILTSYDYIPWGIMTLDVSDRFKVTYCNRLICQYLGMEREAMTGQKATDIFRIYGVTDDVAPFITGDHPGSLDIEHSFGGKDAWFRLHFIPYVYGHKYCLVVMEDATEGKIRESKYSQSLRLEALGQLAGGVAHDFNNLLSIIDGYARLGKKTTRDGDDIRNCLDKIMQAVQRGSAITKHLLTFGSHKIVGEHTTDLGRLVTDQQVLLKPLLDATIRLSVNVEDGLYIDAPEDAICQILLNLAVNSRDAMPDGGHLIVEAGQKEEWIFLRVIDTGCGMPPDIKAKMFDPFFTTKDQGKGTGLGLSMVYGLVKDMKGDIDVVSKLGEGTAITLWLPASQKLPQTNKIMDGAVDTASLEGLTVLVAEDEPDLLETLSVALQDFGITVLKAANGNEALRIQGEHQGTIDFLLTDVVMPEVNGVKLSELFHEVRPGTAVIFMSGYPANGQMARVPLPAKAVLLPKPVQIESLASVLQRMAALQEKEAVPETFKTAAGQWRNA